MKRITSIAEARSTGKILVDADGVQGYLGTSDPGVWDLSTSLVNATGTVRAAKSVAGTVTIHCNGIAPSESLANGGSIITLPVELRPPFRIDLALPFDIYAGGTRSAFLLENGTLGVWGGVTTDRYRFTLTYVAKA